MMLVRNAPPTVDLAETSSQSKFKFFSLTARVDTHASPNRCGEGNVFPSGDPQVVKVKSHWLL
jgi:hypothetical protein